MPRIYRSVPLYIGSRILRSQRVDFDLPQTQRRKNQIRSHCATPQKLVNNASWNREPHTLKLQQKERGGEISGRNPKGKYLYPNSSPSLSHKTFIEITVMASLAVIEVTVMTFRYWLTFYLAFIEISVC